MAGSERAEPFRLQATDLATYLLYDSDREFVAANGGAVVADGEPSPRAEWHVAEGEGGTFTLENVVAGGLATDGAALAVGGLDPLAFVKASGCPDYPEIDVCARGKPSPSETSFGETRGFWDPHMHLMAFEAFGKRR